MSETNYIRINKVIVSDKFTEIKYTDYRDQDKSKEEGRYEMKKSVEIPGVGHKALELAFKKLVPHFLAVCHMADSEGAKKTAKICSVTFKGEHRDTVVPVFELEGTNKQSFKVNGPDMYIHDTAKSKQFRTCVEDFLEEIEVFITNKDTQVQLVIDFTSIDENRKN